MTETPINSAIMAALGTRTDCKIFRMNSGAARNPRTGQLVRFGAPGMPDLLVLAGDRYVWLETKTQRGTASDQQKKFHATVRALGGAVAIVRSAAEAVAVVDHALGKGQQCLP